MYVVGVVHPVLLAWKQEVVAAAHHTGMPEAPGGSFQEEARTPHPPPIRAPKQNLTFQISKPPVLLQDREQLGEALGVPQGVPVLGW